jgi:hypothetical protein
MASTLDLLGWNGGARHTFDQPTTNPHPAVAPGAFPPAKPLYEETSNPIYDGSQPDNDHEQFDWVKDEYFTSDNASSAGPMYTCAACLEDKPSRIVIKAPCEDWYCHFCASKLFETAATDQARFPASCHGLEIPIASATSFLTPNIIQKYHQAQLESTSSDRTYCTATGCGRFLHLDPEASSRLIECPDCGITTCGSCKARGHEGPCSVEDDTDEMEQLMKERGWRACFNCNAVVERSTGCSHMTCRCGAQFCYRCGSRWRTCECRLFEGLVYADEVLPGLREARYDMLRLQRQLEEIRNANNELAANTERLRFGQRLIEAFRQRDIAFQANLGRRRVEIQQRREERSRQRNIELAADEEIRRSERQRILEEFRQRDIGLAAETERWWLERRQRRLEELQQTDIEHSAEFERQRPRRGVFDNGENLRARISSIFPDDPEEQFCALVRFLFTILLPFFVKSGAEILIGNLLFALFIELFMYL